MNFPPEKELDLETSAIYDKWQGKGDISWETPPPTNARPIDMYMGPVFNSGVTMAGLGPR